MLVRDYLKQFNITGDVTFIKARARKDAQTPFYHPEYQTTPINHVSQWQESRIMNYIVLNDKQSPIDWLSGVSWSNDFKKGRLTSLLVISQEDLELLYPGKEQRERMIKYIDGILTKE